MLAAAAAFSRFARAVAAASFAIVFALFVSGVFMRYVVGRPLSWVDEAVTLLSVWSTFWTAAFVLTWRDHIAFDIVFSNVGPVAKRVFLLLGLAGFVSIMGAALPGMVDYTLFLWRERTDAMQLRLDWVYSIFSLFFMVIVLRMIWSIVRLLRSSWRDEVADWSDTMDEETHS